MRAVVLQKQCFDAVSDKYCRKSSVKRPVVQFVLHFSKDRENSDKADNSKNAAVSI